MGRKTYLAFGHHLGGLVPSRHSRVWVEVVEPAVFSLRLLPDGWGRARCEAVHGGRKPLAFARDEWRMAVVAWRRGSEAVMTTQSRLLKMVSGDGGGDSSERVSFKTLDAKPRALPPLARTLMVLAREPT